MAVDDDDDDLNPDYRGDDDDDDLNPDYRGAPLGGGLVACEPSAFQEQASSHELRIELEVRGQHPLRPVHVSTGRPSRGPAARSRPAVRWSVACVGAGGH